MRGSRRRRRGCRRRRSPPEQRLLRRRNPPRLQRCRRGYRCDSPRRRLRPRPRPLTARCFGRARVSGGRGSRARR
ncbi:MAG: hypothetical protein DRJ42_05075 [Deltaproteobacteria bacterium]|nr:MAG: hypothetical protein DRJ42_05075 [Deltaproteobacteria bacterium]